MKQYIWVILVVLAAIVLGVLITLRVYKNHINKTIRDDEKNVWISYPFILLLIVLFGVGSVFAYDWAKDWTYFDNEKTYQMHSDSINPLEMGNYYREVDGNLKSIKDCDKGPFIVSPEKFENFNFDSEGNVWDMGTKFFYLTSDDKDYFYSLSYDYKTRTNEYSYCLVYPSSLADDGYVINSFGFFEYVFDNLCMDKLVAKAKGPEFHIDLGLYEKKSEPQFVSGTFIENGNLVDYSEQNPKTVEGEYIGICLTDMVSEENGSLKDEGDIYFYYLDMEGFYNEKA